MRDQVKPVEGRRALRSFVDLPRKLYAGDPNFVPPLTSEEVKKLLPGVNPYFHHAQAAFWILERDGIPVGRISAARDRSFDEFHGKKAGFFGHFEAPDLEGARLLLEAARSWLREREAEFLRGPVSLSTNYVCGLLVEGFDGPPVVEMPYNPPAYADWLQALGLAKIKDLLSLLISRDEVGENPLGTLAEKVRRRSGIRVRPLDRKTTRTRSRESGSSTTRHGRRTGASFPWTGRSSSSWPTLSNPWRTPIYAPSRKSGGNPPVSPS